MNEQCGIVDFQVNEKVARTNALFVVSGMLFFVFTTGKWILLILVADFFIRGFIRPRFSPFSFLSKKIHAVIKTRPVMINAGPKVFASRMGFAMCASMFIFYLLNYPMAGNILTGILLVSASLEAFFGYCVGCKIYSLLKG